jgi:hypothetical protein
MQTAPENTKRKVQRLSYQEDGILSSQYTNPFAKIEYSLKNWNPNFDEPSPKKPPALFD